MRVGHESKLFKCFLYARVFDHLGGSEEGSGCGATAVAAQGLRVRSGPGFVHTGDPCVEKTLHSLHSIKKVLSSKKFTLSRNFFAPSFDLIPHLSQ